MPWNFAYRALRALLALYGLFYAVSAVRRPVWFAQYLSLRRYKSVVGFRLRLSSILVMAIRWIACVLGVGVLVYFASYALLSPIALDFEETAEEDIFVTTRLLAHLLLTLAGEAYFIALCEDGVKRTIERLNQEQEFSRGT